MKSPEYSIDQSTESPYTPLVVIRSAKIQIKIQVASPNSKLISVYTCYTRLKVNNTVILWCLDLVSIMSDNSEVSISSLEMTRNPFDSDIEEKSNYPGFSPSMFVDQRTPVNNRKVMLIL